MARKKQVKKRTSKKVPKKTIRKKAVKKKVIKKPIVKKPKIQEKVIEALEKEVRKPTLEKEPKDLPKKEFREEKRRQFGRFPREQKRFERPRRFQQRRFPQRTSQPELKSHGERQIAGFLKEERIHFLYEYPLAITDEDRKVRVWYPDFWLPELNIIIEYMGMKGKGEYDKANFRKKKIYNALKIDFIEITPGLLVKGNWKRFIAMKIISIMRSKGYLYRKMKTLSQKYRIPAEERAKEDVGLEILD